MFLVLSKRFYFDFSGETGQEQIKILISKEKGDASLYGVASQMINATFFYTKVCHCFMSAQVLATASKPFHTLYLYCV